MIRGKKRGVGGGGGGGGGGGQKRERMRGKEGEERRRGDGKGELSRQGFPSYRLLAATLSVPPPKT
jgi:hypothetical protein